MKLRVPLRNVIRACKQYTGLLCSMAHIGFRSSHFIYIAQNHKSQKHQWAQSLLVQLIVYSLQQYQHWLFSSNSNCHFFTFSTFQTLCSKLNKISANNGLHEKYHVKLIIILLIWHAGWKWCILYKKHPFSFRAFAHFSNISIFSAIMFSSLGYHTNNQKESEREGREWSLKFRPLLSVYVPLTGSICQSTAESWQLPFPLVFLPPHHVIAADDTKAIVQSEKGLACTC